MTNLLPRTTGLPMVIWIGPRYGARYDVRVKVCCVHGSRMIPTDLAVMSVRPTPELLHGDLSAADVAAVTRWIEANRDLLIDIWDENADALSDARSFVKV